MSIAASSIHFDAAVGDLTEYKEVVEKVRNLAIKIYLALDKLPQDAQQRSNPRYGKAKLDEDVNNEDLQLSNVETILRNHQDLRERLDKVREDNRHDGDDPTNVPYKEQLAFTSAKTLQQLLQQAHTGQQDLNSQLGPQDKDHVDPRTLKQPTAMGDPKPDIGTSKRKCPNPLHRLDSTGLSVRAEHGCENPSE